jgi:HlyD family secretion protein
MIARNRRWIVGSAALGIAAAALALARPRGAPGPRYETAVVDRGPVVARVTASGTVSARRTVEVSSQVSGRVKEIAVDFNSPVKRGQLLARIDPQPFEAKTAQAGATAAAARANLEKARAELANLERRAARQQVLAERKLIAAEEWESAQSEVQVAQAAVAAAAATLAQAKAALDEARFNLTQTAIRTPIDGIVVSRNVDEGQTVAASLQAPTLFTIAEDLKLIQVEAHVSEADVGRLAEGMPATFTVDAFPRERMGGTLRQVRNAAETVSNVVTYDVVLDADNPELRLKPGMTAKVTFTVAERQDALRIPNAALRFRPPTDPEVGPAPRDAASPPAGAATERVAPTSSGAAMRAAAESDPADRRILYVVEGGLLRPVPVRVGVTDGTNTEITSGEVEAGAAVAVRSVGGGATGSASQARGSSAGAPPPPRMF